MVCWGNCPCHPKGTSADHSDNKICPQVCLTEWKPVCGSNGKTYGNDCELERASCQNPFETITKQCEGQCPCSNCPRELVCRGKIGGYSDKEESMGGGKLWEKALFSMFDKRKR